MKNKKGKIKLSIATVVLSICVLILAVAVAVKISSLGTTGDQMSPESLEGRSQINSGPDDKVVYSVNIIEASMGTVSEYIRLNGDVVAGTSVEIYPDTSGELIKRSASVGEYVKKGQILAEVDPSRPGTLYEANPVLSPISGTVTRLPMEVGENVTSQTSIATIGDLRNLEISTFVPERFIGGIMTDLTAGVNFESFPEETFPAEIIEVSPVLDTDSRTLEISLHLTGDWDGRIKAGMFASIQLYTDIRHDVIQIPTDCLIAENEAHYVYIVEGQNAVKRTVAAGLQTIENVQITSGLTVGDAVVLRGQSLLSDGAEVRVID